MAHALGNELADMKRNCSVSNIDVACNSFMPQLTSAEALVESGTCRYGLPFQSSLRTRSRGKSVDTFQAMGSMSAVNIPFGLHVAEREGRLKDGDLAVFFAGGSGETWSSVAVRWGRCGRGWPNYAVPVLPRTAAR